MVLTDATSTPGMWYSSSAVSSSRNSTAVGFACAKKKTVSSTLYTSFPFYTRSIFLCDSAPQLSHQTRQSSSADATNRYSTVTFPCCRSHWTAIWMLCSSWICLSQVFWEILMFEGKTNHSRQWYLLQIGEWCRLYATEYTLQQLYSCFPNWRTRVVQ